MVRKKMPQPQAYTTDSHLLSYAHKFYIIYFNIDIYRVGMFLSSQNPAILDIPAILARISAESSRKLC